MSLSISYKQSGQRRPYQALRSRHWNFPTTSLSSQSQRNVLSRDQVRCLLLDRGRSNTDTRLNATKSRVHPMSQQRSRGPAHRLDSETPAQGYTRHIALPTSTSLLLDNYAVFLRRSASYREAKEIDLASISIHQSGRWRPRLAATRLAPTRPPCCQIIVSAAGAKRGPS